MWLWLKKSAARPADSRSARRRDPTRRRALPPRRRALPPPPSGPAAALLRRLRLELLADGRLQRARSRRLRTPTRGICRRVTGVSVRRPAASRPAGSRILFLHFTEFAYNSIKIPVNEFYVKRYSARTGSAKCRQVVSPIGQPFIVFSRQSKTTLSTKRFQ